METQKVDSSHIHSIGYDKDSKTMEITFQKGGTYHYQDVPHHAYKQLLQASSHGQHFSKNIKNSYQGVKK